MPTLTLTHDPDRPTWRCQTCANPWPCAGAQAELLDQFGDDPEGLAVFLALQFSHACSEIPQLTPIRRARYRFFGWVNHNGGTA